jgi:hypothetical protein
MDAMPPGPKPQRQTAEQELRSLLKWPEQQGLMNVAEALHRVLIEVWERVSK